MLFSCSALPAGPAQAQPVRESDLTKIAEGVYAQIVLPDGNAVSNYGVVVLDRSVLVFDTHFTSEGAATLLSKIHAVTPKPVRYVVNSHYHPDHTHGNQVFAGQAQIIGSTNTRRDMLQKDLPALNRTLATVQAQLEKIRKETSSPETDEAARARMRGQISARRELLEGMSRLKIVPPLLTLDDRLILVEGKREVELRFLGIGHTDGDVVLYLPAEKILFLGDLFFNEALPNTQDASVLEWTKTLEEILKIDADKYVPGHGPMGARKDLQSFLEYFVELKAMVEPAVTRGDSIEQILRDVQIPAKFSSWRFQNFFPANVQQMYVELRARQLAASPGSPREDEKKTQSEKPNP